MNRRRNLIIAAVAIALVVIAGAIAARPRATTVTATVRRIDYTRFVARLPETGIVQRPHTATLAAQVAGTIERIAVKPGDRVVAGALLATLSNPQLVNAAQGARDAYRSAAGRAESAVQTNAVLPAQNRSGVVQAEYNLEQARFTLNAAITDQKNGAQSGLGYGGATAESQRVAADAQLANARTALREAQRIYDADKDLFANRALSRDALDQQAARLEQARVGYDQAKRQRDDTDAQLRANVGVLGDRVRAARDAVRQATAALDAAKEQAAQNKTGDVAAAQADAAARLSDLSFADDQVRRLTIRAPFDGVVQTVATQSADALRPLQPGDAVTVGMPIVSLASDRGFIVRARVDEQDVAHVHAGQRAQISGEDLGTATLSAHVAALGAVAQKSDDPSNTSRQVIATIALDGTLPYLRDGMTVDVDIVTAERRGVLVVPADAIRRDDGGAPYVFVVRATDGRSVKTPVTLGPSNEAQSVVTRGLHAGDTVVTDRNPAVVADVVVKAAPSPSPSPTGGPGGA